MKFFWKTILIVVINLVIVYFHSLLIAIGETRQACTNGTPLYDLIHDLANQGHWLFARFELIDVELIIGILSLSFLFLLITHVNRHILIRRYLVLHSVMSIIRGISVFITTLPSPTSWCFGREIPTDMIMERSMALIFGAIGIPVEWFNLKSWGDTCCDMIISGHTSMLVILALTISSALESRTMKVLVWCVAVVGMAGTTTSNLHYSVDVLLTFIIIILLYKYYEMTQASGENKIINWIEDGKKGIQRKSIFSLLTFWQRTR